MSAGKKKLATLDSYSNNYASVVFVLIVMTYRWSSELRALHRIILYRRNFVQPMPGVVMIECSFCGFSPKTRQRITLEYTLNGDYGVQ